MVLRVAELTASGISPFVRILYFGLPLGALHLAACGRAPVAAAVGHPEAPGMRRLRRRLGSRGVLVLGQPDLGEPPIRGLLASLRPDAILSFFWPRRIPAEVLGLAPRGAFGVHPSLLPRWRGPDPYFWAIRSGDGETGVTLHRLDAQYDTGPVVAQRRLSIDPGENAWQLARRLDAPALELLADCARDLHRGLALEGTPQPEEGATFAPTPTDADLVIDWRQPAESIVCLVRAAAPYPGAAAMLGEQEVRIVRAHVSTVAVPAALRPAEAWLGPEGVAVRAGSGAVLLERVQAEDGAPVAPEALLRQAG
jgi:methionyl-tRNA formyltransferase